MLIPNIFWLSWHLEIYLYSNTCMNNMGNISNILLKNILWEWTISCIPNIEIYIWIFDHTYTWNIIKTLIEIDDLKWSQGY